jgi:hypothetical protein
MIMEKKNNAGCFSSDLQSYCFYPIFFRKNPKKTPQYVEKREYGFHVFASEIL